jgi:hypothetical protein
MLGLKLGASTLPRHSGVVFISRRFESESWRRIERNVPFAGCGTKNSLMPRTSGAWAATLGFREVRQEEPG